MAFIFLPGTIRSGSLMRSDESVVLVGAHYPADLGFVVWKSHNAWVMIDTKIQPSAFDCVITTELGTMHPRSPVYGIPCWSGEGYCLYHNELRWVICSDNRMGALGFDDEVDIWWEGSDALGEFVEQGKNTRRPVEGGDGETEKIPENERNNITAHINNWPRWESETMIGTYTGVGGATGTRDVGCGQWTDGTGKKYIKDAVPYAYDAYYDTYYYHYGDLKHDRRAKKWVIGTRYAAGGWWEGPEPSKTESTQYVFMYPDPAEGDAPPEGADITLTFDTLVMGSDRTDIYVSEGAIWRP